MMDTQHILFELGCEELPPKSLKTLRNALTTNVKQNLAQANIQYADIKSYASPRRLALQIIDIAKKQPDRVEQKCGPAVKSAFDSEGNPTRASQGFAHGLGVDVKDLITIHTDRGDYIGYEKVIQGQLVTELLPDILQKALDDLPIAKRMRSGASKEEFVRPVQWVVLMADDAVISATIQGHQTGNQTRGHRFYAPNFIQIPHVDDYEAILEKAFVIADFDKRQQKIYQQVTALAQQVNADAIMPADLVDEVTALVDYPVALRASFEQRFLQVPQEALISTMQADQKYFCLTDKAGKLLPYFVFISNIDSDDGKQIIAGNEKVVRPRLADAEFFFLQDQKQPLIDLLESLKSRIFQDKLGTIWEKSQRIAKLSAFIASLIGADTEEATRAGLLAKCDLASSLVGEFPELQGIAGTYYAHLNGEATNVAKAIQEQYLPKFSGDELPQTDIGTALALADRLDTLVGIFAIDQAPSGSKDPFSLRRSAIGILRILIEKQLPISLIVLIEQAIEAYADKIDNAENVFAEVINFINSRYRAMYEEQGMNIDSILAVQALNPHIPLEFDQRLRAVQAFRELPQAKSLSTTNKRVANILVKSGGEVAPEVFTAYLQEHEEKVLYQVVMEAKQAVQPLQETANYTQILQTLANLQQPLDDFFDHVMVNVDDVNLKANRLALLQQVRQLFLIVADISELQL